MELSLFLGKLFGFYFIGIGFMTILGRKNIINALKVKMDSTFLLFAGAIVFVCGLALVLSHNIWATDWRLLITLIGWGILVKGLHALLFPKSFIVIAKKMIKPVMFTLAPIIMFVLGGYLLLMTLV